MTLFELEHGQIRYSPDRLATLSFNPLQLNSKNHLTLTRNIDPDDTFQQLNSSCEYYIEDQFKEMLVKKCRTANTKLSVLHLNIRSINKNLSELTDFLQVLDYQFHAIGISETWLNEYSHSVSIENYDFIHSHRKNRRGGGVGLYLGNNLDYKVRQNLKFENSETTDSLFVEVTVPKGKNIIIGVVYRAPDNNLTTFVKDFNEVLDKITKENKLCYLMGDFNVNIMNYQTNNLTGEFLDSMYSNLLCPLINRPTRITSHTATLIDNIITNNIDADSINGLLFTDISDHLPIFSIWFDDNFNTNHDKSVYYFRDKSENNVNKFNDMIANYDWTEINTFNDPIQAYTKFIDEFSYAFNVCLPLKKKTKKNRIRKPWISNGLLKSIKTKNRLYKKFIRHPEPLKEVVYKNYRNKLVRLIRVAKRLYYDKKIFENKTNIKQTFKYLNEIVNKKKNKPKVSSAFTCDNQDITDPVVIANKFC